MKKLYDKNQLNFALIWIVFYVVGFSLADAVSEQIGILKSITLVFGLLLALVLYLWVKRNGLKEYYGLCMPVNISFRRYLFFLPLIVISSTNLWYGIHINNTALEIVLYIASMILVGFLEELIFRGFLFKALAKRNIKTATLISSVTFGLGHIVNLLNGAEFGPTLLQVCYAIAIGYMFTILFIQCKSLLPCIIVHGVFNSLSIFASGESNITTTIVLSVLAIAYAVYLQKQKSLS